jgi:uncharacterized protein YndB with AHSA1/START domain
MSRNRRFMPYQASEVFAVLADGDLYGRWVVGARRTVEADPRWPQPGSTLLHQQGVGPLRITDTTTVIRVEPPTSLELEARVRPLITARVVVSIAPVARGSLVQMEETVVGGALRPLSTVLDVGLHRRNAHALRRLEEVVAERARGAGAEAARAA